MATMDNLTHHLLIAMPGLVDPNFDHTVTYLCAHGDDGAMGIVINRPANLTLADLLQHLDLEATAPDLTRQPVLVGGPVQKERGFVLHRPVGDWEATLTIGDGIGLTTSKDILAAIGRGDGPQDRLVALGYAGWDAGQLEQELSDNAWLSGPAQGHILFDTPSEARWAAAARALGVDVRHLSGEAGHA